MTTLAWHYTIAEKVDSILTAGHLWGTADEVLFPGERPVVWFSLNQTFEPAATKRVIDAATGLLRDMTWREMRAEGLYRFGVSPRALLCGDRLRRAARIPAHLWRDLHTVGLQMKADPTDWFGHVGSMSIDGLRVERISDAGTWSLWPPHRLAA
ncbi:MAG: hypothetical protein IV093_04750 [Rubrivivax sp.]|nr:hypothetical protein [Rubrivivax sp.]